MKNKLYYNGQKIKGEIKTYVAKKETDTEFEKMIIDIMGVEIKLSMGWIFRHKKKMFVFSQDRSFEEIMLEVHQKYLYDIFPSETPFNIDAIRKAGIELKSMGINKEQRIGKMFIGIDPAMPKELQDQIKKDLGVDKDGGFKGITAKQAIDKIQELFNAYGISIK